MADNRFFRAGLEYYPAAAVAKASFESEMINRLRELIATRKEWGPFRPVRSPRPPYQGGGAANGWWICVTQWGTVKMEDAAVELGFWWNCPAAPSAAVLYSAFYKQPSRLVRFPFAGTAGISSFEFFDRTFLASAMPQDLDPNPRINQQLDVLLAILSARR